MMLELDVDRHNVARCSFESVYLLTTHVIAQRAQSKGFFI